MTSTTIPCPIQDGDFVEPIIREVLVRQLPPVKTASKGDVCAIAQSFLVNEKEAKPDLSMGYHVFDAGALQPMPFRSLDQDAATRAAPCTAHILDNLLARRTLARAIFETGRKPAQGAAWFNAIYMPDGILVLADDADMADIENAHGNASASGLLRFLRFPQASRHAEVAASKRIADFLEALSRRINGYSATGLEGSLLVPGKIL